MPNYTRRLHRAVLRHNTDRLRRLLESGVKDVNGRDGSLDFTPLMLAVMKNKQEMAEMLLRHRADVSLQDREANTAVMLAVWTDNHDLLKVLLDHGGPVDLADRQGVTPLEFALEKDSGTCVRLLLAAGASLTSWSLRLLRKVRRNRGEIL